MYEDVAVLGRPRLSMRVKRVCLFTLYYCHRIRHYTFLSFFFQRWTKTAARIAAKLRIAYMFGHSLRIVSASFDPV